MNEYEIQEVVKDLLYIGSAHARRDEKELADKGISRILDLSGLDDLPAREGVVKLAIADTPDADLRPVIDKCLALIREAKAKHERCLVHCNQGISRSAAIVLAYLIADCSLSLHEAFRLLKEKRSVIMPNTGFLTTLIEIEKEQRGSSSLELGKWGQLIWKSK